MVQFYVAGSPIAGEDPRERMWRAKVAAAAVAATAPPGTGVVLDFVLEPPRVRLDIDNLARPALDGLRDAGVWARGYRNLNCIVATKRSGDRPGLTVTLRPADDLGSTPVPGKPFLTAASGALPREGNRRSKLQWRAMVDAAWDRPPIGRQSVFVDIDLNAYLSLKDLMKPIIDGLEPVLGHDPSGRLEFVPNDDLIIWLRVVRRVEGTPRLSPPGGVDGPRHALRVRVGLAA